MIEWNERKLCIVISLFNWIMAILYLDDCAFATVSHMWTHITQAKNLLAKVAFSKRVAAVNSFMLDLFLLIDSKPASFADHAHKVTFIEFVCSKD